MLAAAIWISLSPYFLDDQEFDAEGSNRIPTYYAVMMSFCVPVICATFAVWTKYAIIVKKISASDFTFGYFLLAKGIFVIASIIHFQTTPVNWGLWRLGYVGNILDCLGCFFANCAIQTGRPVGPILALCDG